MTASRPDSASPMHVGLSGGGVAGLEAVMALRDIAGERVRITLVAPGEDFLYRPLSVGEPFALGAAQRVSLAEFARQHEAELCADSIESVVPDAHNIFLGSGAELGYDKLIVAVGARRVPAYAHVTSFRGQEDVEAMHGLVEAVEMGYVKRIAFVVPPGVTWSLPLYELALMTARRAFEMKVDVELTFVTPEERALPVFGAEASADVAAILKDAGIQLHPSTVPEVPAKVHVTLDRDGGAMECDRIVALAAIEPSPVSGFNKDNDGLLQID